MKKAIGFILIFALAIISGISVWADDTDQPATISINTMQQKISVGDTVIVKVDISAVKPIGRMNATVTYDPSVLTFVSGDSASADNGTITIEQLNGLGTTASVNLTFTASSAGSTSVNVTSCTVYDAFDEGYTLSGSAASMEINEVKQTSPTQTETTTQTSAETDANGIPTQGVLVDLQVDNGSLVPPFMYSIHEYSVTVPYEVEKVEIDGKTASLQDNIWYTGNPECVVGRNVRTITVTDVNGQQTTYTIYITRLDKDEKATAAVTEQSTQPQISTENTAPQTKRSTNSEKIKDTIIPALYIVLIVLVVALVIVIIWIKTKASNKKRSKAEQSNRKNERQRSKIKVSGNSKTNRKR